MPRKPSPPATPSVSRIFSALGDPTRLHLVQRLVERSPRSVTELGDGLPVTRQGVTKHLQVLEEAGVVTARKQGRERLYTLEDFPLRQAREFLAGISAGWDRALSRLREQVEED